MITYRTRQGDMVDAICREHYGSEDPVEQVHDANPGLAAHGPILPMGLEMVLPEVTVRTVRTPIRLWGRK